MDISAPGGALNGDGRIWSTTTKLAGNYEYLAGTSMALSLIHIFTGSVQSGCTRIDKMDDTVFSHSGKFFAGNTFHRFGAPVSTDVGDCLLYTSCTAW